MIRAKQVHCIGIGGIGLSAAAKFFALQGANVTGSDMHENEATAELIQMGIDVKIGHDANRVPENADLVLVSIAIPESNVELVAAKERGVKVMTYPEFLGSFADSHKVIAVTGTHGKSTTTAMIAKILIDTGFAPHVFLGTRSEVLSHGNYHKGSGVWVIVEACEYKESMQAIRPHIGVVTNVAFDHPDYYKDEQAVFKAMKTWLDKLHPADDVRVVNGDDDGSAALADGAQVFRVTERTASEGAQSVQLSASGPVGDSALRVTLQVPGRFNAENAGAAFAAASALHIASDEIKASLHTFTGTWRRFERIGSYKGAEVISDYAHHPDAIVGTLAAARELFPGRRIVALFEPHQHARTEALETEFEQSFKDADAVLIAEIYGVEGRNGENVTAKTMADALGARFIASYDELQGAIDGAVQDGDVLLVMGAGTIDAEVRKLIA